MTIKEELIVYANDCISDKIPSCQKHKWACQRFLNDLKKSESVDYQYQWVEQEAEKIVKWFSFLKHSKGSLAGSFISLTTFQKFFICQIYGWRHKVTGFKRFTISFLEVGRKNAKSQMEAGIVLYEMAVESSANNEIYETYCAGTKREQSGIIFNECKNLLKGSPLAKKFKICRDRIEHIKTGSFLKPLCKEDGKKGDGTNPAVLILDEYHQHQTTEFYDLGLGANSKQSLLMIITTAGVDLTYPCYTQEYEYVSKLLNPDVDIENENYLADVHEAEKNDDISELKTWKKANPIRAYYYDGIKKIQEAYKIAKFIPEKMTAFLTKVLNIWVQSTENGYMDMSEWKQCEVSELPIDIKNQPVYVGFDMSAKIDLTSVAFVIPFLDDGITKYIIFSHSFIPNRKKLQERTLKDKVPYDAWERNKYLTVTDSEVINQNTVMQYVLDFCKKHSLNIEMLCFDPANSTKMMLELSDEGYNVAEVYQSHKSLNDCTCAFREQVYEKNVLYINNPVLNFAMSNAKIKTSNGLIKIDKDAVQQKIDPVDAVLCGFKLAMYHQFEDFSLYDDWLDSDDF